MGLWGKKSGSPHEKADGLVAERSEGPCPLHFRGSVFPLALLVPTHSGSGREKTCLGVLNGAVDAAAPKPSEGRWLLPSW